METQTKEIFKGNELIARFIGAKSRKVIFCVFPKGIFTHPDHDFVFIKDSSEEMEGVAYTQWKFLRFHESWDWLMPVLEKIKMLKYPYLLSNNTATIYKIWMQEPIAHSHGEIGGRETTIQSAWICVVQFIKWYNKQNKK